MLEKRNEAALIEIGVLIEVLKSTGPDRNPELNKKVADRLIELVDQLG
jgi:hypothetical protein